MTMTYECDVCGRQCSRIHCGVAYGTDTAACDDCAGYEPEAYGEKPDPDLLREMRDENRRMLAGD